MLAACSYSIFEGHLSKLWELFFRMRGLGLAFPFFQCFTLTQMNSAQFIYYILSTAKSSIYECDASLNLRWAAQAASFIYLLRQELAPKRCGRFMSHLYIIRDEDPCCCLCHCVDAGDWPRFDEYYDQEYFRTLINVLLKYKNTLHFVNSNTVEPTDADLPLFRKCVLKTVRSGIVF